MSQIPPPLFPVRVQPLPYMDPVRQGRPGLITAIGVLSIVLGSLGICFNGFGAIYAGMGLLISSMPPAIFAPGYGGNGMTPMQAKAFRTQVQGVLSPQRLELLDSFLDGQGQAIPVGASVVQTGSFADVPDENGLPTYQISYIVMSTGRIDIADDYVAWYPQAGAPGVESVLPQTEVDASVREVMKSAGSSPSTAQLASLRRALACPHQELVAPQTGGRRGTGSPTSRFAGAPPTSDGSVVIYSMKGGMLYLPPDNLASVEASGAPATASPATMPIVMPSNPATVFAGIGVPATIALVGNLASIGVAIYLLVIGILVFRWSRRGRRHHLWFVWLKIPITLMTALGWWWIITSVANSVTPGAIGGTRVTQMSGNVTASGSSFGVSAGFLLWSIIFLAVILAYPIGLLIVLRSRTVREYYEGLQV